MQRPLRSTSFLSPSSSLHSFIPLHMLAHPPNSFNMQQQRCLSTLLHLHERTHLKSKVRQRSHLNRKGESKNFRYQIERNVIRIVPSSPKLGRDANIKDTSNQRAGPSISFQRQPTKPAVDNEIEIPKLDQSKSGARIGEKLGAEWAIASTSSATNVAPSSPALPKPLTHLDESGSAHMVDVSRKRKTYRRAVATATLFFSEPTTFSAIRSGGVEKGDVLAVSRIAAIQAAKQTSNLIPLAHPALQITGIEVDALLFEATQERLKIIKTNIDISKAQKLLYVHGGVAVTAKVRCYDKTGVEMEALTAASLGCLTMYDMLKGIDKNMMIVGPQVIEKTGGRTGSWKWDTRTGKLTNYGNQLSSPGSSLVKEIPREIPEPPTSKEINISVADNSTVASNGSKVTSDDIKEWNLGLAEEFSVPLRKVVTPENPVHQTKNTTVTDIHSQTEKNDPNATLVELARIKNYYQRRMRLLRKKLQRVQSKPERPLNPPNNHATSTPLAHPRPTSRAFSTQNTEAAETHDEPEKSADSEQDTQPSFRRVIHSQTRAQHSMVTRDMISAHKMRKAVDQRDFEKARVKRFEEWVKSR